MVKARGKGKSGDKFRTVKFYPRVYAEDATTFRRLRDEVSDDEGRKVSDAELFRRFLAAFQRERAS